MLLRKGGRTFGWRVTPPVLSWFLHIPLWFLYYYATDGIMLVDWGCRWFLHIFTEKETVVQINWLLLATPLLERFGWIDFLLFWVLISFGTAVDFLPTDSLDLLMVTEVCCFLMLSFFFLWGSWYSPPSFCNYFSFFNKISWVWRYRMEISRGANLVGMSMKPLDADPPSFVHQKKNKKK